VWGPRVRGDDAERFLPPLLNPGISAILLATNDQGRTTP
jgi:hypothetical protein